MERTLSTATRVMVGLVLLTPLIVMSDPFPKTFFPYVVGKALYARTLIETSFLLWILLAIRRPEYRIPRTWLIGLIIIYLSTMTLATIFGVSSQRSLWSTYERMMGLFDTAHWFLLIIMTAALFRTWEHWRFLFTVNAIVGIIMALLGLSEWFNFGPVVNNLRYLDNPGGITGGRLDISLGNPTYVGAYYLINTIIAFGLIGHSITESITAAKPQTSNKPPRRAKSESANSKNYALDKPRIFLWTMSGFLGITMLFLSGTRGALIGLIAGISFFVILYMMQGRIRALRKASLFVFCAVLALVILVGAARSTTVFRTLSNHSVMIDRMVHTGASDDSVMGRLNSVKLGWKGFLEKPLFGWGPENFTIAYDRHLTAEIVGRKTASFDQAHNKIIEELSTKGIFGFLAYIALWIYGLKVILHRSSIQNQRDQIFTFAVAAGLAGYFAQNLFLFDTPGTIVQFVLLVGFVTYLDSRIDRNGRVDTRGRNRSHLTHKFSSIPGYNYSQIFFSQNIDSSPTRASNRSLSVRRDEPSVGYMIAAGILVVGMSSFILLMNTRPYKAARLASDALQENTPWRGKIAALDESFSTFPPLANHPVLFQTRFKAMTANLNDLRQDEIVPAMTAAQKAGTDGLARNPKEWRIMMLYAQFYQSLYMRLNPTNPEFLERSQTLVEQSLILAPQRMEVQMLNVVQKLVEGNVEGAKQVISRYLAINPNAEADFAPLQKQLDSIKSP